MGRFSGDITPRSMLQGDLVQMLYEIMYYLINTGGATAATYFTVAVQNKKGDWTGLTSSDRRITPNGFSQADLVQAIAECIYAAITVPLGAGYTEADHTGRVAKRIMSSAGVLQFTGGTTTRNFIIDRNGWNQPDIAQILYEMAEAMIDDCAVPAATFTLDAEDKVGHLAGVNG